MRQNDSNSLFSNFMSEIDNEEVIKRPASTRSCQCVDVDNDEDDSEFYSKLIITVQELNPLWDHRLPIAGRFEPIKQKLWDEIYVELNGRFIKHKLE